MKDYRVEVKIKNNYLHQAMLDHGIASAAELSRLTGITQVMIGDYLNLKRAPINTKGQYAPSALTLAKFFDKPIEELFPIQHIQKPLKSNKFVSELDIIDVAMLLTGESKDPESLLIEAETYKLEQDAIELTKLSPKERQFINSRLQGKRFEVIASELNITKQRVGQLHNKSIRKVRRTVNDMRQKGEKMPGIPKNEKRIPKVGDRVTRLGGNPFIWGTVTKVTDLNRPGINILGLKRYTARVIWDGQTKEDMVSATYLFYDGDKPIQLGYKKDNVLVDPKRK